MEDFTNFAVETAKKAGRFLLANFRKDESIAGRRGLSKEVTTKYDKESDRMIVEAIGKKFPGHDIMAEESSHARKGSDYLWIVDSMDGSGNFANGNPFFSVSIALAKNNHVILGVIYAPKLDELFVAEKGRGATLNGKKIHVSEVSDLSKSYLVSCEGADPDNRRMAKAAWLMHPRVKDYRKLGSAAMEGGFVASGRAEAYITFRIQPWDVAAAVLLVEEAGGKVTDFKGRPWGIEQTDLVMSNGKLHDEVLEAVKGF